MAELRKPNIKGNDHEMIAQMRSYLYQLVDELQYALNVDDKTAEPIAPPKEAEAARRVSEVVKKKKELQTKGWYKLGTIRGDSCAVVTLTIGGDDQTSPSMIDIATEYNNARLLIRVPSLKIATITRLGLSKESEHSYGLYAYYVATAANRVEYSLHTHMGTFSPGDFALSSTADRDLYKSVNLTS